MSQQGHLFPHYGDLACDASFDADGANWNREILVGRILLKNNHLCESIATVIMLRLYSILSSFSIFEVDALDRTVAWGLNE